MDANTINDNFYDNFIVTCNILLIIKKHLSIKRCKVEKKTLRVIDLTAWLREIFLTQYFLCVNILEKLDLIAP